MAERKFWRKTETYSEETANLDSTESIKRTYSLESRATFSPVP